MPKAPVQGKGSLKDLAKRQVFKPVLFDAYTQSNTWPEVKPESIQTLLDLLEVLLSPIGSYNQIKAESKDKPGSLPDAPEVLDSVTLGFNSTVKALERQVGKPSKVLVVFVCKADISPTVLTDFFPTLACTSSYGGEPVRLIALPRGSMAKLSQIVGKPHTGIIGVRAGLKGGESLFSIANTVAPVTLPWLDENKMAAYMKPNVKVLATSAPVKPPKTKQQKKK
ncbi:hypothetical protein DIURU_002473 [Diutina rugosa]|uniref:Uncharacterized protein n=1 Tax=Diutina rugosa TaxID=5481 RepID=A0A642UUN9_DIURU|nr:uncharacterized protein DIURU_002473 [Diutina rugosa]KAA8903311.1 hypothetical protein DIURU_002473 [Diutina rugosa]